MNRGRFGVAVVIGLGGAIAIGSWARATAATAAAVATEGTQPRGLGAGTAPADIASKCASCHAGGVDDDGKTFRPWDTWSGTMMAHATRDPLFLAALTVAEQDAPGSGAFCLRCHTPKGFVKGNATGIGAALDADDNQGVDCEACHRSINASVTQPALDFEGTAIAALGPMDPMAPYVGNARLFWDPRDVRHGPYDDASSPAHVAAGSAFASSSAFCGQCHEVLSPLRNLLDSSGADTGFAFPLDNTYTEWLSSDFGRPGTLQSCVDCHMPKARGDSLTVATFPSAMRRASPRMHLFVGGNEWGLDAIQMAAPDLAIEREAAFMAAKEATKVMLAGAVQVDVMPVVVRAGATTLDVRVRVTNLSGHKFPTGYADGRRAFLQVELLDAGGRSLMVLGRYDESTQRLDAESTRVWESIQAERTAGGGHHEWHIAKNDIVFKDTRIPPKGFRPEGAAAIAMTAPVGADYGPATGAGMRNHDDVQVRFTSLAPLSEGTVKVTARVFYQSTMREFIDELVLANTTDDRGRKLKEIWEQTGRAAPRLIQSKTMDVTVGPAAPDGGVPPDGGAGGGMGAGGSGTGGGAGGTGAVSGTGGNGQAATSGSGGCSCDVAAREGMAPAAFLLGLLGLLVFVVARAPARGRHVAREIVRGAPVRRNPRF